MVLQGGQFAGDLRLPASDPTGMRANMLQRERLRMSAIFVHANTNTLQDYQCNVPTYASPSVFESGHVSM